NLTPADVEGDAHDPGADGRAPIESPRRTLHRQEGGLHHILEIFLIEPAQPGQDAVYAVAVTLEQLLDRGVVPLRAGGEQRLVRKDLASLGASKGEQAIGHRENPRPMPPWRVAAGSRGSGRVVDGNGPTAPWRAPVETTGPQPPPSSASSDHPPAIERPTIIAPCARSAMSSAATDTRSSVRAAC